MSLIRPAEQPSLDLEQAAHFLTTFGKMLAKASPIDQKRFFRTVLEEVYVENRKIVAIRPKPNYYDLLRLSLVRPNGANLTTYTRHRALGRPAGAEPARAR